MPHGLAVVTDALAEIAAGAELVAGIDARGFLLGGAVADKLGIGVLAVRKGGQAAAAGATARPTPWNTGRRRSRSPPTASIWPGATS